jgi:hypothetical protein
MVALAEIASPRRSPQNASFASEVPCEFAWSDGAAEIMVRENADPQNRNRGCSREDIQNRRSTPGISREDSASSGGSGVLEPASSMSKIPGTSSFRVLPVLAKGMALDAHLEDHFEDEEEPRHGSSSGPSPALSSISSPRTPVNGQSTPSGKWQQRNRHRRRHKPPKPREGWQQSLCQQVIINYPAALPTKDTFVKSKVPRPVSREPSVGSLEIVSEIEKVAAKSTDFPQAGLPEAAASRLRESSPEVEFPGDERTRLRSESV